MTRIRARSCRRSPRLYRHDRFLVRDLARQSRKLERVSDAFEIQHDHCRIRIVGPVRQQVIVRDVGAIPRAPLCEYIPRLPVGGSTGAKVALSRIAGSVFSTPMQFGPTIRIPDCRTISKMRCWRARPAAETSAKPEL